MGRTQKGTKRTQDPNKPKRSTSAYFYFLAHCREEAKKCGKSISKIAEFTKESSAKWREMNATQKKKFEDQAAKDKARYDSEMASYKGVDADKPKKAQTAYFLFLADYRLKMKGKNVDHKDIIKNAGAAWQKLSSADKTPYEKKAQEEQRKYEKQMSAWKADKGESGSSPAKKAKVSAKQSSAKGAAVAEEEEEEEEEDEEEEEEEGEEEESDDE